MHFALTDDQTAIQDTALTFAKERIAPGAAEWDEKSHFPVDVIRETAGLGMATIYVPAEQGGSGLSRLDGALIFEAWLMKLQEMARDELNDATTLNSLSVLNQLREQFGPECLPLNLPADGGLAVADCFFAPSGSGTDFSSVAAAHTEIVDQVVELDEALIDRKSTRLNSSHRT